MRRKIWIHVFIFSAFFCAPLFIPAQSSNIQNTFAANNPIVIKFDPKSAVDFPFDSLFKFLRTVELQPPEVSQAELKSGRRFVIRDIVHTDSFLVVNAFTSYYIFDHSGKFIRKVGSTGDGPNSNRSLSFHYTNNESILSISTTKWIKYGLNGLVLERGKVPYHMNPYSIFPIDKSTWLFYSPMKTSIDDGLRLWTTDKNFNIKRKYLHFREGHPTGMMGFTHYIYPTSNGIYITDRVVDTIYQFIEKGVFPRYIFDYGTHIYYRTLGMRKLNPNEITCEIKLVTSKAVLFKVLTSNTNYFVYYDRIKKVAKTIKRIVSGPDLLNSWSLKGFDNADRQYWQLSGGSDTLVGDVSKKYGYAEILKRNKGTNPIILITNL